MRLALLGPAGTRTKALEAAARFVLEQLRVDRAVYLGVDGALDEVIAFVRGKADVTGEERELQTFNDGEALVGADFRHWQG